MRQLCSFFAILSVFGALSACSQSSDDDAVVVDARDPLIEQALGDHLMVDPDLASQNEANAALTVGFDSSIPPILAGPERRAAAKTAMRTALLEGGAIADLPSPDEETDFATLKGALTAAERASRVNFAKECAQRLNYSAVWAARLPDHAVLAPRGAVTEAAGNPEAACNIRIISYLTDLPVIEVMQFHYNQAARAKLTPAYSDADESVLLAKSAKFGFAVHARENGGFQTQVDLISREY